jgi:hypothetical protein
MDKLCTKCNELLDLEHFNGYFDKQRNYYRLSSWCKQCKKAVKKHYRSSDRRVHKDRDLRRHFGITIEDYEELLNIQGHQCKICGRTPEEEGKSLAVDHCHVSGKIRGLLCYTCNTTLGHFNDSVVKLASAIRYLVESATAGSISDGQVVVDEYQYEPTDLLDFPFVPEVYPTQATEPPELAHNQVQWG